MSYFNDRKIVIGSSNKGKLAEIKELFDIFHLKPNLKIASEFTNVIPDENGNSFDENALIKARFYANITGLPVITDDSGLEIHDLNGFPGINTAPYAKSLGGYKFAFADLEKRLIESESHEIMKDHLRGEARKANFHCSICYYLPSGEYYIFSAKVFGILTFPARGEDGFGFDPIFVPDGYNKSFAELGAEKSLISHRYKAFEQFINHFSNK